MPHSPHLASIAVSLHLANPFRVPFESLFVWGCSVASLIHPSPRQPGPAGIRQLIQHSKREKSLTILAQSLLRLRAKTTVRGAQIFIFALLS